MKLNDEGATAEIEAVEPQGEEQPKSMDDTIRETLRGLQAKGNEPEVTQESVTPEAPEETAQRIRDEKGKFAAKDSPPEVPTEEIPQEPVKPAPNTWRKELHDKWATLPPEVQAEVERREADFHKGIEGYKQKAQFADTMEKAITPYMATIQSLGISPDKAIGELMAADHRLRYGSPQEKHAYFAQLAQTYGIDLGQVQQPQQQQIDPNISYLQQKLQAIEGAMQQQTLMGQQQEQAALNSEIARFAADPNHSHFESVKGHMAALLQAGQAKDLPDAYEQAVYANPTTRQAMLQQQAEAMKAEAAKKAQAAKEAASVNVKARPSMPPSTPIGSMDDTIRSTLRRLQGG